MSQYDKSNNGNSAVDADRIGIVIPCYNHGQFIADAIQSAVSQTFQNIAITVINDGSTDNSNEIIRQQLTEIHSEKLEDEETYTLAKIGEIPVIVLSHDKNEGAATARNKGILAMWKAAKYFCMLDADCMLSSPEYLTRVFNVAESDKRIGIVYNDWYMSRDDGALYVAFQQPFDRNILEHRNIIPASAFISKLALEMCNGLYDTELTVHEDWELWLRITERLTAIHIPEALQTGRIHKLGRSTSEGAMQYTIAKKAIANKTQQRKAIYG